ncbi:MAG: hypothetical protein ACW96X_11620 [Promethearchaeota archaeon]|jgi:hypothetical protein
MKDATRSSMSLIAVDLFIIAFGIVLLSLVITQWALWVPQLMLTGMVIIIIISLILIAIGFILIKKFIT